MTAVNNDVGAVAFFSLFLWSSVRLVCRGFSWRHLTWTLIAVLLCVWTKGTVYLALPLSLIALLLSLYHSGSKRFALGFLLTGLGIGVLSIFSWGDAAHWHRATSQNAPTQAHHPQAPLGDHALRLNTYPEFTPNWLVPLYQPLARSVAEELQGKSVTLGAWIWADQPLQVRTPTLHSDQTQVYEMVDITNQPTFYSLSTTIPDDTSRIWITISPVPDSGKIDTTVYYDGIVLTEGDRPAGEAPQYDGVDGRSGYWGGRTFHNWLNNPSFEGSWFFIRAWFDSLSARIMPDQIRFSSMIASILDISSTSWYYRLTGGRLVRTFWAKFGWGHVPIMGQKPYRSIGLVTILGIMGALMGFYIKRRALPWKPSLYMGLVLFAVWGITLVRGCIYLADTRLYLPVSRYAYPAIIPTMLILSFGWWQILSLGLKWIRIKTLHLILIFIIGFVTLDILSILSIVQFFQH
jgi:hypothetical protein